ncbi:MAG TPA: helix-turn-helix domain-containing protein [Candidatus Cloacimonadota bacterium]|nr:helix-turn-helix domain-containing protein [Candidatus Cloacimonadota bacterium]HPS40190.1 helix-turn-helix domain-containing protein [Candidatus Cloacimonadota bacterium]
MTNEQILDMMKGAADEAAALTQAMSLHLQRYLSMITAMAVHLSQPVPAPSGPEFLTYKQAAELLQVSRGSLYEKVKNHKIPFHYIGDGKTIRFKRSDLLALAEERRVATNSEIRHKAGLPG